MGDESFCFADAFTHGWLSCVRYQPINWEDDSTPMTKWEPRRGRRLSLVANVCTPQGPLVVFSVHLEVFTGIVGRLEQFSELLRHSKVRATPNPRTPAFLQLTTTPRFSFRHTSASPKPLPHSSHPFPPRPPRYVCIAFVHTPGTLTLDLVYPHT